MSAPRVRDQDVPDDERHVRAMLMRAVEPGTPAVAQLLGQLGAKDTLAAIVAGDPIGQADVEGMRGRITPGCAEADLAAAARVGARLVIPSDDEWPRALDDLAPLGLASIGLWVRGQLELSRAAARSVAIVGTRASTSYGNFVASTLAADLAARGWAVVSGMASGIDSAAHRGALSAGTLGAGTIAVLACGIDAVYPKANAGLHQQICAHGVVVSEHPPGSAPHRTRFLVRNRIIAALACGTLVVEAAARSGARSTARHAGSMGRHVMAVPGPVNALTSIGCHQMLRDDPTVSLVTCVEDIVEMVGAVGDLAPRPVGAPSRRDVLDPLEQRVLDAVPVLRPAAPERVAVTAGLSPARVVEILERLARSGFVVAVDARWRLSDGERKRQQADRSRAETLDLDWW